MKKFFLAVACLSALSAATLQRGERDRAMSNLHATRKHFSTPLPDLSEAQWNFKPDEKTWSVAEAAEHIAISEDTLWEMIAKQMLPSPAKTVDLKANDEAILKGMVDRIGG
jgi:DinB superfamily